MINYSEYYREIRPMVGLCPDFIIDYALNRAVREFCRQSWVYEKTLLMDEVADQKVYDLDIGSEEEVLNVISVARDDVALKSVRATDMNQTTDGFPQAFSFEPPESLILYPTPSDNNTGILKARAVLMPSLSSRVVPEMLDRLYRSYIVFGTLSYLQETQDDAWSNPQMAMENRRRFEVGIAEAKGQRARGFSSRGMRIKPRTFL